MATYEPDYETASQFVKEPAERERLQAAVANTISTGQSFDLEFEIVTGAGNTRWVRMMGEAEFAGEQCVRMYGNLHDIHTKKQAELALQAAYSEKNTVLESIGDVFFTIDPHYQVTYWNQMAERLLSVPKAEILHKNLWEVFADATETHSYRAYQQALESQQVQHFEDYYPALDRWFEVSAYPSSAGLSVYFKDISERKATEAQLTALNLELQSHVKALGISNHELEQFAYIASHDLQEPLRMITGFLNQLERKYEPVLDARGKKYIHFAVDGAQRMRQIILALLEFSRINKMQDRNDNIDLNGLLEEIVGLLRKKIEERGAQISWQGLPQLQASRPPMRQLFQNLIDNALKYCPPERSPQIVISAEDLGDEWQFQLADNGIGIAPEYFQQIFVIFQRLHAKNEYPGTGLGLAMCKKIVENFGGRIWVTSEAGQGTSFWFTLKKQAVAEPVADIQL